MMRAIIGGAVGAAVATVVWLGLENNLNRSFPWMVLIVGLCAGLGVRMACKPNQRSITTGGIALMMALIGMVGGNFANYAWLRMGTDTSPIATVSSDSSDVDDQNFDEDEAEEQDAETDDAGTDEAETDDAAEPGEQASDEGIGESAPEVVDRDDADEAAEERADFPSAATLPRGADEAVLETELPTISEQPGDFTNLDLAYYGIGCLFAYLLGTGGGVKQESATTNSAPRPTPTEPPAES